MKKRTQIANESNHKAGFGDCLRGVFLGSAERAIPWGLQNWYDADSVGFTEESRARMFACPVKEGVELRLLELRHTPVLFQLLQTHREALSPWVPWLSMVQSAADVQGFLSFALKSFSQNTGFQAGIWEGHQLVGILGHMVAPDTQGMVTRLHGFLVPPAQGKGTMTHASRVLIDRLFEEKGMHKIEIRCASAAVNACALPKRLGFIEECFLRGAEWGNGGYRDVRVYGMLASEWAERRGLCFTGA